MNEKNQKMEVIKTEIKKSPGINQGETISQRQARKLKLDLCESRDCNCSSLFGVTGDARLPNGDRVAINADLSVNIY